MTNETIANRYITESVLGSGGMGSTYRARRIDDGALVALKVLNLHAAADWKTIELFEREAAVLRSVEHPNVPRYVESFEREGGLGLVIVQELAPGMNLLEHIKQNGPLKDAELVRLARTLLGVLVYLQSQSPPVFHRDLKPQNVVISESGEVHLVDFGAVRAAWEQGGDDAGGSTVVGTFGYMAPEQFRGHASKATDLYGLGTTLLFAATGRDPSDFPQERMQIQFADSVAMPPERVRWLGDLLRPHEEDRFTSAQAALDALDRPIPPASQASGLPAPGLKRIEGGPDHLRVEVGEDDLVVHAAPRSLGSGVKATGSALVRSAERWGLPALVGIGALTLALGALGGPFAIAALAALLPVLLLLHASTMEQTLRLDRTRYALDDRSLVWRRHEEGKLSSVRKFDSRSKQRHRDRSDSFSGDFDLEDIAEAVVRSAERTDAIRVATKRGAHSFGFDLGEDDREWLADLLHSERRRLRTRPERESKPAKTEVGVERDQRSSLAVAKQPREQVERFEQTEPLEQEEHSVPAELPVFHEE